MARVTREQQRLLVAQALRNLNKPDILEESDLVTFLGITPYGTGFWPHGVALSHRLQTVSQQVIRKLDGVVHYHSHRQLLLAVLSGSSISAWARQSGHARETVSRTTWREVTALVAKELFSLKPVTR